MDDVQAIGAAKIIVVFRYLVEIFFFLIVRFIFGKNGYNGGYELTLLLFGDV